MPFFKFLPPDATVRHVMMNQPERYLPIGGTFTQNVLRGPSPFTVAERELIATYVSGLNQCQYCHGAHRAFAVDNGVDPALFEQVMSDADSAAVADQMKPVLRYVKKLTLTPSRMTQADADAVFAAGWDERALGDAVAVCALFNFFNRIVEGHGVRGSDAIWNRAAKMIRESGYETFLKQAAAERAAARAGE
jgi:uncharacterized peroxidase-related enzyme